MEASVVPFLRLGFSNGLSDGKNPRYDKNGLAYVDIGVNGILPFNENLRLQPEMKYVEGVDDLADSEFVFGMNLIGDLGW